MHMPIPTRLVCRLGALGLVLAIAAPASAQRAAFNATDSATAAMTRIAPDTATRVASIEVAPASLGASLVGLRAGVHAKETARPNHPTAAAASHANLGQARAMMIVGVAALVAGAIIGDTPGTVIMVGGAVIGLVGLYDYLQ